MPNTIEPLPEMRRGSVALLKATGNGPVPRITLGLVDFRANRIAGNTYTIIRAVRKLPNFGESVEGGRHG